MQGCSNISTHTMSNIKGGGDTFDNRAVLKLVDNLPIQSRAGKTSDNSLLDTTLQKVGLLEKLPRAIARPKWHSYPPPFW